MIDRYLNWINLIVASVVLISTLWLTSIAYGPMPFWDAWATALLEDSWGKLWTLHNGHLIMMPRLIYGLDTVLSDGNGFLSLTLIFVFQSLSCLLLVSLSKAPKVTSAALAICFLFWARHLENLSWPFQVGFIGLCFMVVLTMWLLSRSGWLFQTAAFVTASIAPMWSINGLLVPLICAFISALKKKYISAASYLLFFLASVGLYLYLGFEFAEQDRSKDLLGSLVIYFDIIVRPFLDLLGVKMSTPSLNMAVSTVVALILHGLAVLAAIKSKGDARHLSLLGVSAFGFGSCLMAALARSENYTGPAFRYAVFSALALLPLLLIAAEKLKARGGLPRYAVVVSLLFAINNFDWKPFAIQRGDIQRNAIAGIQADPNSLEPYRLLYPSPEGIAEKIQLFRERGLSIF
ncbi:hypothetical protein [Rhizobium sp. RU36D]|uniref:hypothetical protein n=1 Tax=Rhizobium sp. RU36D TaxID=1907415 RepID=UPI00117A910E|nr:hypothetical protein [Rhizobium sp. RU36D]